MIIGAGAIGCLVGGRLALAGQQVTLIGRPPVVEAIQAHGLTLSSGVQTHTAVTVEAVPSLAAALAGGASFDLAILTVKAYDTATVMAELAPWRPHLPPLLTLQNGVGNEERLAGILGAGRVIAGAITTPVTVTAPGVIEVTRRGRIALAAVDPRANAFPLLSLAALFAAAGLPTRVYEDFRALKWTKLLMNQLANATCAILGWLPAQVMADPRLADLEIAAWRETLAVMATQRIRPVTLGGYPFPWLAPLIRTLPPAVIRLALGRLVGGARGGKAPSLYLDLAAGKGRTEVAYLNGAVAAASAEIGTPVNRVLTETLQALSAGQTPWEQWRDQPARLLQRVQEARR
ncbi:MAG: 2-dehydropantoate 2-reductase [Anaerolineae bacterium]|uniref:ketopantoate reductase family protein n=1 Tax=Candidatus Amarolinea dominans TaxID=3140696 RepID=UPI0031CCBBCF